MKRCLLLSALLCVFSITHMYAETTTPSITLTTTKTDVIEMKFGCRTAHTIHIDWGDGKLVETVEIADSATVYPTASSAAIHPTVVTGTPVNGGKIKTFKDHRIAMAFSTLNLISDEKIKLDDEDCINVSFPGYFDLIKSLTK